MPARILLVEDDEALGDLLKEHLEIHLPTTVIWVRSIAEAERTMACTKTYFTAGIFDCYVLGGKTDGIVRKFCLTEPEAGAIAISGDVDGQKQLINAGCTYQHPKPFSLELLVKLLKGLSQPA